jgi:hypothetical protein
LDGDFGTKTSWRIRPLSVRRDRFPTTSFDSLDQAAAKMKLAAQALSRAPKAFTEALRVCGALHEAGIVMHLANQGERLAARG